MGVLRGFYPYYKIDKKDAVKFILLFLYDIFY